MDAKLGIHFFQLHSNISTPAQPNQHPPTPVKGFLETRFALAVAAIQDLLAVKYNRLNQPMRLDISTEAEHRTAFCISTKGLVL